MLSDFRWVDEKDGPQQLRRCTSLLRVTRLGAPNHPKTWVVRGGRGESGWVFAIVDYENEDEMPQHLKDALIEMTMIKYGKGGT